MKSKNFKGIANDCQLDWIQVASKSPYFITNKGEKWTPIGQNDSITWPDLQGLFLRKDTERAENYMKYIAEHGVTCIRMMMEYCHTENRYFEKPIGRFNANMVRFWDDMILLCEKHNIRLLITPFDTFWMNRRWKHHPYNQALGGPCRSKRQWLTSPDMIYGIKERFTFFIERWGHSGAIFGWDLWNEISPVHAGNDVENINTYINEISTHIRNLEMQLFSKSHVQTVSAFAPLLEQVDLNEIIFKHPLLDFASTHFYHASSIDRPRNAINAAIIVGNMVKDALEHISDARPFLDSEHGPITYFKKNRKGLPEAFDNLYFLHMQWAHLASGAAGGGLRWPYRNPHTLTHGMRKAQRNMSEFVKLLSWKNFQRINISDTIVMNVDEVHIFACGDYKQAIIWLLNKGKTDRLKNAKPQPLTVEIGVPGLAEGNYHIYLWDTMRGLHAEEYIAKNKDILKISIDIDGSNVAIAIRQEL